MNKKVDLEMVINILSFIKNNEKCNIDELVDELGIKKKQNFKNKLTIWMKENCTNLI